MAHRSLIFIPLFVALLAYLQPNISLFWQQPREYVQGTNATVLFITNVEHGLSNAHIATAQSLLEHHHEIDVHYASFAAGLIESKLKRMADFVRRRDPRAKNVKFHPLAGKTFELAGGYHNDNVSQNMVSPPGIPGLPQLMTIIDSIHGWTVEEHLEIYTEVIKLIEKIDPAVVVLDTMMAPAVDATRAANRAHIIITPNTLAENFAPLQPYGRGFWKYPALGTGFSYPLPWRNIPENLYVNFRIIVQFLWSNRMNELRQAGIKDPSNLINMHREDVPWITMNTEGAALPVHFVPVNVTGVGPMVLSSAPAVEQDAELVAWASRGDTILINLGSFFKYTRDWAGPMVDAVADLLDQAEAKVQVLWKLNTRGDVPTDLIERLQPHIDCGRLRLSKWLTVDPMSLLESGSIALSVHHGGSNCYHEAVQAGVPQVILPMWADLYAFASLVENIGIGIWPCKRTAPRWTREGLLHAMSTILDDKAGAEMRRNARMLGEEVRARPAGRDVAAMEVAKLAFLP